MKKKEFLQRIWVHRHRRLPPEGKHMLLVWHIELKKPMLHSSNLMRAVFETLNYSEKNILGLGGLKQIREDLNKTSCFLYEISPWYADEWYLPLGPLEE